MINPVILKTKGGEEMEEGCLSFPNQFAKVIRPTEVVAEYTNTEGKRITVDILVVTLFKILKVSLGRNTG